MKLTKEELEKKTSAEIILFRAKITLLVNKGKTPTLRKDCKVWMKCVCCGVFKERTTEYFHMKRNNFQPCVAGNENLKNSPEHPCIV